VADAAVAVRLEEEVEWMFFKQQLMAFVKLPFCFVLEC